MPCATRVPCHVHHMHPFPMPLPAYTPTIDLTTNSEPEEVIDLTAESDGEFVPFDSDAQCVINHMFRHACPYHHTL